LRALDRPPNLANRPATVADVTVTTFEIAGRTVQRIGYGAMQLPGRGVFGPPKDHEEAIAVLRRAVDAGVNHIDTAQYYGPDVSNELIREALHPYPDDLVIVSKVGGARDDQGGWLPAQTPAELRSGVEANLRTLELEQLGAVNLRRIGPEEGAGEQAVALDDQLAEMVLLRDEGKIGGIGISNASLAEVDTAIESAQITCVQNPYSLVAQDDGGVLERCIEAGIAFVPFFPLGSAFPNMPKVTDNAAVRAVAERIGATPAQVGLAWLLCRADNILLIPGTSSLIHLEENLAVRNVTLSAADLAELNDR
jgi:aryl-alcohol dehydrogenase-like predicted oxidoreductase